MVQRKTLPEPDYQQIFKALPGLYLILLPEPDFTIAAVTDAYARATMIDPGQVIGKGLFEIFPDNPDDPKASGVQNLKRSLERVLRTARPDSMAVQKYDVKKPNDPEGKFEERYWSPINSPVLNDEGKVVFIIHRVEDVTEFMNLSHRGASLRSKVEQTEAEIYLRAQEIQEANKKLETAHRELEHLYKKVTDLDELKTQFFSNVSHELRTPLTLILGPVQQMMAKKVLPPEDLETLAVVERNALTLLKQVNDLLDVAKLEAGKMKIHYSQTDLARLLRFTASHFETALQSKGVAFFVETPSSVPVQADEEKIQRVIMNILSNAIKFVPSGGWVKCSVDVSQDRAVVTISDNGPGVKKEFRSSIFDRFTQEDGGPERSKGGTGLGLAIARDFVDLHGGEISVLETPGGGATFRIEIPLKAPTGTVVNAKTVETISTGQMLESTVAELNQGGAVREGNQASSPRGSAKVLVVEDNPDMREFIQGTLSRDFNVITAEDGEAGLEAAQRERPDLIITDLMMPKKSGASLIEEARQSEELKMVPIILLTARADDQLKLRLLGEGCQDYLLKPFSQKELLVRSKNWITVKRMRDLLSEEVNTQSEDLMLMASELARKNRELKESIESLDREKKLAEQASEAKGKFLSLISHELNTPLTSLLLTLEMIIRNQVKVENQKHFERILTSARKLRDLIGMLLDYARTQNGKLIVQNTEISVDEIAHEVVNEARPLASSKNISLEEEADVHGNIISDPRLIRIIMNNLLSNAIKYTSDGKVQLSLKTLADKLCINVSDTGVGISNENVSRIFEPFEQLLSRNDGPTSGGVGLGLSLVKDIVSALGGEIRVTSRPGVGSSFSVYLPKEGRPSSL